MKLKLVIRVYEDEKGYLRVFVEMGSLHDPSTSAQIPESPEGFFETIWDVDPELGLSLVRDR